jgi:hypothetical protein
VPALGVGAASDGAKDGAGELVGTNTNAFLDTHLFMDTDVFLDTDLTDTDLITELTLVACRTRDGAAAEAVLKMQINKSDRNDAAPSRLRIVEVAYRRWAAVTQIACVLDENF